jgi:hypothetical protein
MPLVSDRIFDEHMTTYDVFQEIAKPIIDAAVQGFHGNKNTIYHNHNTINSHISQCNVLYHVYLKLH